MYSPPTPGYGQGFCSGATISSLPTPTFEPSALNSTSTPGPATVSAFNTTVPVFSTRGAYDPLSKARVYPDLALSSPHHREMSDLRTTLQHSAHAANSHTANSHTANSLTTPHLAPPPHFYSHTTQVPPILPMSAPGAQPVPGAPLTHTTVPITQTPLTQAPITQSVPTTQGIPLAVPTQTTPSTATGPAAAAPAPGTSKLAASSKLDLIKDYIQRHAGGKLRHADYCYRHHPNHSNLLPDKYTLDKLRKELDSLPQEDTEVISHMWNLFGAASGRQRQIIMRGMLSQCCFPQLSDVTTTTKELLRIDFISALPAELAFKVLRYLDAKSLSRAAMVSHRWQTLANDDIVWYHLCEQHIDRKCTTCGWGLPLLERTRLRQSKQAVQQRLMDYTAGSPSASRAAGASSSALIASSSSSANSSANSSSGSAIDDSIEYTSPPGSLKRRLSQPSSTKLQCGDLTRPWKDVYIERFKIEQNWRQGKCVVKDFMHPAPVLSLQFDEQYLISGTSDGAISIWDVETKKRVRTLKGHIRGVSALKFDSCKLVTGSWDQSVRVWNYRTGQCLCTFGGHESKILCIDFDANLIAAGSADATIKIWDFVTKSCFTLRGHGAPVHSVRIHKQSNTLYTSSEDLTVRMWCLESKRCIRVFGGPENGPLAHVAQIQYALPITLEHLEGETEHDHHILIKHEDDAPVRERASSVAPSASNVSTASGASEGTPGSSTNASTPTDPTDPLAAAVCESEIASQRPTHLLTASLDNTIKLWDISTGKCARTLFGHIEGVWSIAADHFRIVSGGQDKLVKVWDVQSGRCWHTYSGHTKPVCSVGLTDTGFASGGDDGLVRLHLFDT